MNHRDHGISLLFGIFMSPLFHVESHFFLRSKTALPGLSPNYLANDFSLKMARGEDTCLHSVTAARYRKK